MAPIKEIIRDGLGPPKPTWCYISGPYTLGDPVENTRAMCLEWTRLQNKYPEVVFVNPLLSMFQHAINPEPYDFWIDYDLALLRVLASGGVGIVYRFRPDYPSTGADLEIAEARRLGVTVVGESKVGSDSIDRYLDEVLDKKPRVQHVAGEVEPDYDEIPPYTNDGIEAILDAAEAEKSIVSELLPGARPYKHPIQSVEVDTDGTARFVMNKIVRYLLDMSQIRGGTLNHLAENSSRLGFSLDDWRQFAQLIGYSLGGFEELTYVGVCYETPNFSDGFDEFIEPILDGIRKRIFVLPSGAIGISGEAGNEFSVALDSSSSCDHEVWLECPNPVGFTCKTCGAFSAHGGAINPEA